MSISPWPDVSNMSLLDGGSEPPLPDHIREFQQNLRKFALGEMREVGALLDRMTPEEVIAPDSPYWKFRKSYLDLGINMEALGSLSNEDFSSLFAIVFEELGYGDAGLAISMAASILPQYLAARFENDFLLERFPDTMLGCWAITEPDHGSDILDLEAEIFHPEGKYGRPNCIATIKGDRIIINGQKSAWVSNGSIADVCILYCAADTGDGLDPRGGAVVVLPLDMEGIERGKPLDKMGQRALNQGEIFFQEVELSTDYLLAGPDMYQRALDCIHTEANGLMAATFSGVAQSAFDLALDYAHERKQGGVPIIRHQSVAYRLFHMLRKTEMSRALGRRVIEFTNMSGTPSLTFAMTAKVTATQSAFEVASDALQIFGGNGLTREYPVEKILRDARASMIEDGCNEVLAIMGGHGLIDKQRLQW